ncbi:MAG: IS1595 family transposase [Candidatus Eiseniibacteriota bacterium]
METRHIQRSVGEDRSRLVADVPLACANEDTAVEFLERQRWGDEPFCPHCGTFGPRQMKGREGDRNSRYLWRCVKGCKKQFTVRVGTVMEDSRIALRHWCLAFYRACASKKGVSALQIKRETGVSYRAALFLMHRIRWAMANTPGQGPLGADGGTVEVDETYVGGRKRGGKKGRGTSKAPVVALVERGGEIRPIHVTTVNAKNLGAIIREHVHESATIMTDDFHPYKKAAKGFKGGHFTVTHSKVIDDNCFFRAHCFARNATERNPLPHLFCYQPSRTAGSSNGEADQPGKSSGVDPVDRHTVSGGDPGSEAVHLG